MLASDPQGTHGHLRLYLIAAVLLILAITAAWRWTPLAAYAEPRALASWLRGLRQNPYAPLIVIGVYVAANLVFFPNTILNVATILGLGTTLGLPCALAGSLCASLVFYTAGRRYGAERMQKLHIRSFDRLSAMLQRGGILGMAALRLLPIAPFGVVNLMAGAARVSVLAFTVGTVLGLLPGNLLVTAFGHQLRTVLRHPSPAQIAMLAAIGVFALAAMWWLQRRLLRE